jgi:hypothetical protein
MSFVAVSMVLKVCFSRVLVARLEESRYKAMFRGTTIEELINSVRRAEERARDEQQQAAAMPQVWQQQTAYREITGVA